jgi:hypothetical protein
MAVTQGLAGLRKKQQEQAEKEAARNRPKAEYFSWKNNSKAPNPDQVFVQFLQELDPSGANYDETKGLAIAAVEHEAPGKDGFKARALCSLDDEGACYACERRKANYEEGWKTKSNFYVNALVDYNGKGDPQVAVISRNFNQSFVQQIIDEAVENGTILGKTYKITKHGTGTQLVWVLSPTSKPVLVEDTSELEVHDIKETVLRDISYEDQPGWYGKVYDGGDAPADTAAATATATAGNTDDVEW